MEFDSPPSPLQRSRASLLGPLFLIRILRVHILASAIKSSPLLRCSLMLAVSLVSISCFGFDMGTSPVAIDLSIKPHIPPAGIHYLWFILFTKRGKMAYMKCKGSCVSGTEKCSQFRTISKGCKDKLSGAPE
ncbi:hypothetical protein K1719_007778 [Acacia pycnantha]|nr:hypothetical protein K1719_007778 [Acacia pycnantha]